MNRTALRELVADCYRLLGPTETAAPRRRHQGRRLPLRDRGGMTIAVDDIPMPEDKAGAAGRRPTSRSTTIDQQYQRGLITEDERYEQVVEVWKDTTQQTSSDGR